MIKICIVSCIRDLLNGLILKVSRSSSSLYPKSGGGPVAQWVKRWPAYLAVPRMNPAREEISTVNGVPLHTAFHNQPLIALIWVKFC